MIVKIFASVIFFIIIFFILISASNFKIIHLKNINRKRENNFFTILAEKISSFMKNNKLIPDRYYEKLKNDLEIANFDESPEQYIAKFIFQIFLIILGCVIISIFFPIFSFISVFIILTTSFSYFKKPKKIADKNKVELEKLLPKFTDFIANSLKNTRDIFSIFNSYIKSADDVLIKELKRTVIDMKTSSIENALINLEQRVKSKYLTEIVMAIIGIVRGDTNIEYFLILAYDLRKRNIYELKREAMKKPSKMTKYSILLLVCFIASYFSVFIIYILKTLKGIM